MKRHLISGVAVVLSLVIAAEILAASCSIAQAASGPAKRQAQRHGRGFGFLPGYRSPEQIAREDAWRRGPLVSYRYYRTPGFYPWGLYGSPGFYRSRFTNSLGPCWTRTPIGPIWNCG